MHLLSSSIARYTLSYTDMIVENTKFIYMIPIWSPVVTNTSLSIKCIPVHLFSPLLCLYLAAGHRRHSRPMAAMPEHR